jgi:hypothetical protein
MPPGTWPDVSNNIHILPHYRKSAFNKVGLFVLQRILFAA